MASSKARGPGQNKRFWTEEEDKALIDSLLELHDEGTFNAEGGFKPGHFKALERKMHEKLPGCSLQAKPHIESRMKTLKTYFQTVHEMLTGPNCSGFGWDATRQVVTAEKPVWDAYLQTHKEAAPFKMKPFPFYDAFCIIYGKDRATGRYAEGPADMVDDLNAEAEQFNLDEDWFAGTTNTPGGDEAHSMSFSTTPNTGHAQSGGSSRSSKRKRNSRGNEEMYEALKESSAMVASMIDKASARLSKAIGEDINDRQMRVREELQKITTLTTMERHKVARMIIQDTGLLSYFFSIEDCDREEWVRGLLAGDC